MTDSDAQTSGTLKLAVMALGVCLGLGAVAWRVSLAVAEKRVEAEEAERQQIEAEEAWAIYTSELENQVVGARELLVVAGERRKAGDENGAQGDFLEVQAMLDDLPLMSGDMGVDPERAQAHLASRAPDVDAIRQAAAEGLDGKGN